MDDVVGVMLDKWSGCFAKRDADAMAELYTEDALFFGSAPALKRGRSGVYGYFASLPPMDEPRVLFSDVAMAGIAADVIEAAMIATFSAKGQGSLKVRLTQTFVQRNGEWKIVAHHASPAS